MLTYLYCMLSSLVLFGVGVAVMVRAAEQIDDTGGPMDAKRAIFSVLLALGFFLLAALGITL